MIQHLYFPIEDVVLSDPSLLTICFQRKFTKKNDRIIH